MPDFGQLSTFAGLDPNRSYRTPQITAPQALYMAPGPAEGLVTPGTIDLRTLPPVDLGDGTWGTVHSESREVPGVGEMLYPTIVNGRQVSGDEAFAHAMRTGRHLGIFQNGDRADEYAQRLHEDWQGGRIPGVQMPYGGVSGLKPPQRPTSFVENYYEQAPGQIQQGFRQLVAPSGTTAADPRFWDQKMQGLNQIVAGAAPFALPLALSGIGAAAEAPAAALLKLGGGTALGLGTQEAAQRLGVPPGQAGLLGTMAGMAGGGLAAAPETGEAVTSAGRALRDIDLSLAGGSERGSWSWKPLTRLQDIPAEFQVPRAGPRMHVDDVARYLEKNMGVKPIPASAPPQVKLDRILQFAEPELQDQMAQADPRLDFYTRDTEAADANIQKAYPELKRNPSKLTIQKAISAMMSPSSNPEKEAETGGQIWGMYSQTGRIPIKQPSGLNWPSQGAQAALNKMQGFLDRFKTAADPTGEKGLAKVLTRRDKIRNLREINPAIDGPQDKVVPGSLILGPKVGRYFNDIMGIPQEGSTVDMWDVRANQRRMARMFHGGKLIETPTPESDREIFMDAHRILADRYGLSRNEAQSGLWHYEKDLYHRLGMPNPPKLRSEGTAKVLRQMGKKP